MYGISVFLGQLSHQELTVYIERMAKIGFSGVFTSLHIPEDQAGAYKGQLEQLGRLTQQFNLSLMVDISADSLQKAGFDYNDLKALTEIGVTGLRMDDGITLEQQAALSHELDVALNASTVTFSDIEQLRYYGADFSRLSAWHNYYPRPETGLDMTWFCQKNQALQDWGLKVVAFAPGDSNLRGPLFAGLPTLEDHRGMHPLASILALQPMSVDAVYIGDGGLDTMTYQQISAYLRSKPLPLRVVETKSAYFDQVLGVHTARQDPSRDLIRSSQSRLRCHERIEAEPASCRQRGDVLIDNLDYLRYMGEIYIAKRRLASDAKVNIAARIVAKDQDLIDCIRPGSQFELLAWPKERID